MPVHENEAPLSDAARDLDDKVRGQVSDLTDLDVQRPAKWSRNFSDRTRRLLSRLLGKERLRGLEGSPLPNFLIFILAILLALIVYLALFVAPGNDDGNAVATQPTQAAAVTVEPVTVEPVTVEPVTVEPATGEDAEDDDEHDPVVPLDELSDLSEILSAPAEGDAASANDGAGDSKDEVEDEVVATYVPIAIHVDVGDDDNVSSFYQLWPEQAVLVTPRLSGGTFDMTLDFEAMTVSGSFNLAYERSEDEDDNGLCDGSPETFSGTARGTFEDLPIREAQTSATPPSDWGFTKDDWQAMNADGWYVGGSIPVELAMSGVAVMGCVTTNGVTTYDETPLPESATLTSWLSMRIDMARDQGADRNTLAFVNFSTETNESSELRPYWRHRVSLSHIIEQPIRDPLA